MQTLEDPEEHFSKYIEQATERYWNGLQRAGLTPNETLTRAIAERALEEAKASYLQRVSQTRDHNIEVILSEHKRRLYEIKREAARLRLLMCPPIAAFFGGMAWYSFGQPGGWVAGILFIVGALAFLAMIVWGAIFER